MPELKPCNSYSVSGLLRCRYCTGAAWQNFPAEFQKRQVLFFPASLYLTLLQQGVADLGMVSLLILDEAHQVTKEHPMSSIFNDFHWKLPSECSPKVPAPVRALCLPFSMACPS